VEIHCEADTDMPHMTLHRSTPRGWPPHLHALLCVATWADDEPDEVVARVLVLRDVHLVAVLAGPDSSTQQYSGGSVQQDTGYTSHPCYGSG
jgi:hypothetical protein